MMDKGQNVLRRTLLAGAAGAIAASRFSFAAEPDVPVVTKRVEKRYKVAISTQPNDLQFTAEGLWILDQLDQPTNKAILVKPEDGTVLREILTESLHGSGITYGNGALWIGSTYGKDALDPPRTLKVDPHTGRTLKSWVTPGWGYYRPIRPKGDRPSGAHGLKWVDGKYWIAVPAASKIYLIEPETHEILAWIPGPGTTPRTHGMAWDNGMLWVINSDDWAIFKLNPKDGKIVSKIQLSKDDPAPHGLDIDNSGALWYSDAGSGWICRLI
jgi:hypothetical protein